MDATGIRDRIDGATIDSGAANVALGDAYRNAGRGLPRVPLTRAKIHLLNAIQRIDELLEGKA